VNKVFNVYSVIRLLGCSMPNRSAWGSAPAACRARRWPASAEAPRATWRTPQGRRPPARWTRARGRAGLCVRVRVPVRLCLGRARPKQGACVS
jgi:hypothetical protein